MNRAQRKRAPGLTPDINVTPLVDVVLVLLIIFMVVTPKMESGKAVTLPKADNADKKTSISETPTTLSVTDTGELFVDADQVTEAAMKEKLLAVKKRRLVIKADERAAYHAVMRVFKICEQAGFENVALQIRAKNEG